MAFFLPVYTSISLSNAFPIQRPLLNPSGKRKPSLEGIDWRGRLEKEIMINSESDKQWCYCMKEVEVRGLESPIKSFGNS